MGGGERSQYEDERDEEALWAAAVPAREPARARGFLPPILVAAVASVPFYWGQSAPIWAGLPAWVWVTIACSAVISALTAHAALRHWDDEG